MTVTPKEVGGRLGDDHFHLQFVLKITHHTHVMKKRKLPNTFPEVAGFTRCYGIGF